MIKELIEIMKKIFTNNMNEKDFYEVADKLKIPTVNITRRKESDK